MSGTVTVAAVPTGYGEYTPGAHTTTVTTAATLPQGTNNVVSGTGAGFLTCANLTVRTSNGAQSVFCTGRGTTSFTGCSGGTGAMSLGA